MNASLLAALNDETFPGRTHSASPAGASLPGADEIRAQALEVARGWSPPGAPPSWRLTAALFKASAAVTFIVRRDRPVPLAGCFPEPASPQPPFDEGFSPAFSAFGTEHLEEIAGVCHSHRYQCRPSSRESGSTSILST